MTEKSKMAELLESVEEAKPLTAGDLIEGGIIYLGKDYCLVDLKGYGTGIVRGRELDESFHSLKSADENTVSAVVVDPEDDEGYVLLSLKRATREKVWDELESVKQKGEVLELKPFDANRGGLLIEYEGVKGFLPVSQLSAENYPRVEGGDKEEILTRLKSLSSSPMKVRVLDVDKKEAKLIFSEKEALKEETSKILDKIKVGSNVKGIVTGVVDFGIFVNIDGVEGLIHISEIDWSRVLSPKDYAEVDQEIEAQVISVDGDKVSLSLKRLKEDPWLEEIKKYKEGESVSGSITRVTPFGVFVDLGNLEALAHVSELKEEDEEIKIDELFAVGDNHDFHVLTIEPETRKIFLTKKSKPAARSASSGSKKKTTKKEEE